ncbi:MAG: hypothetical protein H7Z43_03765 [Clostridia bacterium]|nr:hypothetical protein [Deltaproteobacteria bacterium]
MRFFAVAALTLCASAEILAADMTWREKAQRDLAATRVAIEDSHPGAADVDNPGFRAWLYDGYFKALAQVAKVRDYGGYAAVLRYYVNGFHDVHMSVKTTGGPKPRTPGFLTKLSHGEFVVANRMNLESRTPPIGSTLLSCDGKSAMMVAHDVLDPYFTITQLNAHRWMSAPFLFVDDHNPFVGLPRACKFRVPNDDNPREFTLEWREISIGALDNGVNGILDWSPNMGVRKVGNSMYWVTLPAMGAPFDSPQYQDLISDVHDQADALRASEVVVIDVRSNSGGRAEWGTAIANAIWGQEYVRSHASDATLDMRVSATTVAFISTPASRKAEEGYARLENWDPLDVDSLRSAYDAKRPWISFPVYPGTQNDRDRKAPNPVRAKVVLLTDTWCVSACLMFVDLVFDMGETLHVGLPTNADTMYTGVRKQTLETDNATLTMPTEVFRRRKRAANQTYVPKHIWHGEVSDTYAIEHWVRELPELQKHSNLAVEEARQSREAITRSQTRVRKR